MIKRQLARRRFELQPRAVIALTVIWLALVGQLNWFTVVSGLLVSWWITVMFPLPAVQYRGRLRLFGLVRLALATLKDLAVASTTLAIQAFNPRFYPHAAVVRVPLVSDSDLYQTQTAQLVSIVPGTIVIEVRKSNRILYLHVFDVADAEAAAQAVRDALQVERNVMGGFASRAELEAADRVRRERQ